MEKELFAGPPLEHLTLTLQHMQKGWQAFQQFQKYIQECKKFAFTTKETMLSLAIECTKLQDDVAVSNNHWKPAEKRIRVEQNSIELPDSKRQRQDQDPWATTGPQSTKGSPLDSIYLTGESSHDNCNWNSSLPVEPKEETEEVPPDTIWLCGEGH